MKRGLLIRVFSTVNRLEDELNYTPEAQEAPKSTDPLTFQQHRVLKTMRTVANRMQLDLACDNWPRAVRHLQIFQGLVALLEPYTSTTAITSAEASFATSH